MYIYIHVYIHLYMYFLSPAVPGRDCAALCWWGPKARNSCPGFAPSFFGTAHLIFHVHVHVSGVSKVVFIKRSKGFWGLVAFFIPHQRKKLKKVVWSSTTLNRPGEYIDVRMYVHCTYTWCMSVKSIIIYCLVRLVYLALSGLAMTS